MIAKATNNRIDILTKNIFSCINQVFTGDISEKCYSFSNTCK